MEMEIKDQQIADIVTEIESHGLKTVNVEMSVAEAFVTAIFLQEGLALSEYPVDVGIITKCVIRTLFTKISEHSPLLAAQAATPAIPEEK